MKTASPALMSYINTLRSQIDAPIAYADCFTFTLANGTVLAYTTIDTAILYNGTTFSCTGPLVQGLKYKGATGLAVDKQQIIIAARSTDLIAGSPFLNAIREGAFDGAIVERDRVFMASPGGTVIGGVMLFHGRVATIDSIGRTSAQITVASDLVVLDYDMPRNLYSPTCVHTLYDSGCTLVRATYSASGAAGGSSRNVVAWTGALAAHAQGSLLWTSGLNANLRSTVKSAIAGASLTLMYPLPSPVSVGDLFTVAYGCDHTMGTCQARFGNLLNFKGFPFVPPAQIAY